VTLRDLTRLDDVATALAAITDLDLQHVQWQVDPHNPTWPLVRAAAIQDAITKARDYATALRGAVTAVVHVADEGLLAGRDRHMHFDAQAVAMSGAAESDGGPSLDPVPQEISAVIEARFEARIDPL
jgi:uncharacterized protein YggE